MSVGFIRAVCHLRGRRRSLAMTVLVIKAVRRTVAHRPGRPATAEPRGIGAEHVTGNDGRSVPAAPSTQAPGWLAGCARTQEACMQRRIALRTKGVPDERVHGGPEEP